MSRRGRGPGAAGGVHARAVVLAAALLAGACGEEPAVRPTPVDPLLDPGGAREDGPEVFRVRFETTKGPFVVEARRAWAPDGVKRLYNLARIVLPLSRERDPAC